MLSTVNWRSSFSSVIESSKVLVNDEAQWSWGKNEIIHLLSIILRNIRRIVRQSFYPHSAFVFSFLSEGEICCMRHCNCCVACNERNISRSSTHFARDSDFWIGVQCEWNSSSHKVFSKVFTEIRFRSFTFFLELFSFIFSRARKSFSLGKLRLSSLLSPRLLCSSRKPFFLFMRK